MDTIYRGSGKSRRVTRCRWVIKVRQMWANCPSVWGVTATSPAGALLLCRAEPETVRPVAHLLLAPAGDGWSVLVPEG